MKRKILLGLTGSVATILYQKLIKSLEEVGDVSVIMTPRAEHFVQKGFDGVKVFRDSKEWTWFHPNKDVNSSVVWNHDDFMDDKWKKNDEILHINLRDKYSALIIAPCSANTLAKMANGICDNLLTSVARAWDFNRPLIIAPAMNTYMWEHPTTNEHIQKLRSWGCTVVPPQSKMLACKTEGMGALADIIRIVEETKERLRWYFPLGNFPNVPCSGIPITGHPGAFLTKRTKHTHTGVDLYTTDGASVFAVESGKVVGIEDFTGVAQQTPWWEDTKCLLIEGASGVVCYGEITPNAYDVGTKVHRGEQIGRVKRVLKPGKERPDIAGHSTSMLHLEMYRHGIYRAFEEVGENLSDWRDLIDPTPFLFDSDGCPTTRLE